MDSVNVRNLDQIQEEDRRRPSSRLGTLLLASMGGAALVVVAVVMARPETRAAQTRDDPLDSLLAEAAESAGLAPEKLPVSDVTFPEILSDEQSPTTALAAVKDERGRLVGTTVVGADRTPPGPTTPPAAGERLPVVPLPAGSLLTATPVTTEPKDGLTALAASAAQVEPDEEAPSGTDGGYQIQVASFKVQGDADAFVEDLRKRGHRAYRQAAYVSGRGLWHRVRIGPFKTKFQANLYRKKLEGKERMNAFVVDPHVVKQREEQKAARLAARRARQSGR